MDPTHQLYMGRRKIPVFSINYDFVPSSTFREKMMWVTLNNVPSDLIIGSFITLQSLSPDLIVPDTTLQVEDIEGKRVILTSRLLHRSKLGNDSFLNHYPSLQQISMGFGTTSTMWTPITHGYQWGYGTRDLTDLPGQYRGWQYGYGKPVAVLMY